VQPLVTRFCILVLFFVHTLSNIVLYHVYCVEIATGWSNIWSMQPIHVGNRDKRDLEMLVSVFASSVVLVNQS